MNTNAQDTGSRIGTDRACTGCGFNLIHQPIVRESTHNLLIATCPECGTAAPLVSYPLMSRWVGRWKLMMAIALVAILLGMFSLQCRLLYDRVINQSSYLALPLANELGKAYYDWAITQEDFNTNQQWAIDQRRYEYLNLDLAWLENEGDQILRSANKLELLLRWGIFLRSVPALVISFLFGIFWAATALGATKRRLLILALAVMSIALLIIIGRHTTNQLYYNASWVAGYEVLIQYAIMVYSIAFVCMAIGIWSGRPIARWIIRTTMPPGMLPTFALLWTRDGLDLPRTTRT